MLVDLRVYNFGNFVLEFTLNVNGWWQRLNTIRNFIRSGRFYHGDMENGMNTEDSVRKLESVGMGTGLSKDFERS